MRGFEKDGRELNVRVDGQLVFITGSMILKTAPEGRVQPYLPGVLEILCHSSNIQSKRNDTCPSPSISTKHLKPSSQVRH